MTSIEANGTTLQYRIEGRHREPVVMFSNSLASNLTMWDKQVPVLLEAGFRVLRYDSRGHGGSAVPEGPYSIQMLTDDAIALVDALGLRKVHFCGLSMGGMVGQRMGAFHADRLLSLTLCSTAAQMPPADMWDDRIAAVRDGGLKPTVDATINRWFTEPGQKRLGEQVNKVRRMILDTPVEGYCASCAAIRDMDQREMIRSITTPTLVMVGEEDPGTPVSASRLIHEGIGPSLLRVFSGAAHFLNIEQSEAFNHSLVEFLGNLPNPIQN